MYIFIDIKNIKIPCLQASELFTDVSVRIYRYMRIENSIMTIISRKERRQRSKQYRL